MIFFALIFSALTYAQTNIVLIGDSGKDNEGQHRVALAMQELCQRETCDLGILAGDNVYPKGVTSSTDNVLERVFDKHYNPLKIPFLVALGNHDYGAVILNKRKASYQLRHAKKNPFFVLPHYWYTYETPHAVFAVIDTTRMMWLRNLRAQGKMVEAAWKLAKAKNKWFMVVGHHPYLSNGDHGNAGNYERHRFPFFISGRFVKHFLRHHVCGKADFYLAGHDHSLQALDGNQADCDTQLIISGAAAATTTLSPRNSVRFEALSLGFFQLNVGPNEVKVRAINDNSQVLYEETYLRN